MQQQIVTADFRTLAIDQLRESPTNPRRSFDQDKLQELAQSIRAQGVLVPLIVRNLAAEQFEVVAGARRFRAAQAAELFAVPVRVVELTDDEALTLQLVENAQREDVHPLEEAFAYRALLDMPEPKYDVASIALKVGKSIGHVYGRLRYVDLIEPAAQAFLENRLTAGHALLIARLPQSQQAQALEAAFRTHWGSTEKQVIPVRELAQWIRQNLMLQLEDAIFDREDETLTFSEFSPYATLIGAPTSAATLFWNAQRKQVGVIGFWDVVAFDEVGEGIVVRDREMFQVMKQYMANGNFSRGTTVTANASLAFIGNIDDSVDSLVNSYDRDLFKPLHPVFDLAILDRFSTFVPGWEIPKNRDENLTRRYGLIIEYLAEAFHYASRNTNRFAYAKSMCKLGKGYDQRDQTAVLKTVCAFLKMLHPGLEPTQQELEEYLEYAVEGRRRVKEQLNKRKKDDEFAAINLSFVRSSGEIVIVYCPESRNSQATQDPHRGNKTAPPNSVNTPEPVATPPAVPLVTPETEQPKAKERHYRIHYGATGFSYETIFREYLPGAEQIIVEDPYIRTHHQIVNFLRFCESAVKLAKPKRITLLTNFEDQSEKEQAMAKLLSIGESLKPFDVELTIKTHTRLHDREIRLSSGWTVKIGRGFDIYQRPDDWLSVGANDLDLRPCLETSVDIFPTKIAPKAETTV